MGSAVKSWIQEVVCAKYPEEPVDPKSVVPPDEMPAFAASVFLIACAVRNRMEQEECLEDFLVLRNDIGDGRPADLDQYTVTHIEPLVRVELRRRRRVQL